jgi:ABC-type tungstate transport system permease subunit
MWRYLQAALGALALLCVVLSGIRAADGVVRVGVPSAGVLALVEALAPAFQESTGISITPVLLQNPKGSVSATVDAFLVPDRIRTRIATDEAESLRVLRGDAVLVGLRTERARVRGLRDIKQAFRAIASVRATFASSSPQLGLRDLELALWGSVGVNVQTRLTWYVEASGDEQAVLRQAAALGASVLVERSTFLATRDRRGFEILVSDDPALQTTYSSILPKSSSETARAWHEWLASGQGKSSIAQFRLNGMEVFAPLDDSAPATNAQGRS